MRLDEAKANKRKAFIVFFSFLCSLHSMQIGARRRVAVGNHFGVVNIIEYVYGSRVAFTIERLCRSWVANVL